MTDDAYDRDDWRHYGWETLADMADLQRKRMKEEGPPAAVTEAEEDES